MKTNPKISHAEKVAEAIKRMQVMGISETQIRNFQDNGYIPVFINGLNLAEAFHKPIKDGRIRKIEAEYNLLIFSIITSHSAIGNMESYIYVSDERNEWEMENEDINDGYAMTWTENLTYPECSEFGSIAFERKDSGALWRTA